MVAKTPRTVKLFFLIAEKGGKKSAKLYLIAEKGEKSKKLYLIAEKDGKSAKLYLIAEKCEEKAQSFKTLFGKDFVI